MSALTCLFETLVQICKGMYKIYNNFVSYTLRYYFITWYCKINFI